MPDTTGKAQKVVRDTLIIPVNITKLGMHNTAKPHSLVMYQGRDLIRKIGVANYLLDSVDVRISVVYLLEKNRNGFYRYAGKYAYSPYQLPHEFSNCTIIAFGEKGRSHITYLNDDAPSLPSQPLQLHLKPIKDNGFLGLSIGW
jgi:hypothetical protein